MSDNAPSAQPPADMGVACEFCEHHAEDHATDDGKCRTERDVACRRCSQQRIDEYERGKRG